MLKNFTHHYNEESTFLSIIAGVKWGGHPKVLNIFYKNFIRSQINYGAATYGNAPKTLLQKIDTFQNVC
jgi:hypothetical protein